MTRLGGHVTIFSHFPALSLKLLTSSESTRSKEVPRVSSFLFRAVALGESKNKYAVRRAPLKLQPPDLQTLKMADQTEQFFPLHVRILARSSCKTQHLYNTAFILSVVRHVKLQYEYGFLF